MEKQNNAAKFAFFYMLSLVALIFMAVSTGIIIFQIINKEIVDVLNRFGGGMLSGPLKFAISAIFISTPIYYLLMWQIQKNLRLGTLAKDSGVRKWLTYFILFVAVVVMLGWLVATINNFLNGELTWKFILKSLTSVIIAAAIFVFYYYDIKREKVTEKKDKVVSIYFYASLVAVVGVFVASLFYVESPTETRNRLIDNANLQNFSMIDSAIQSYFQNEEKMPKTLDNLKEGTSYITDQNLIDPTTDKQYEYKVTGDRKYELCTTFRTSNKNIAEDYSAPYIYKTEWPHEIGYQCLSKTLPKELNKLIPAPIKD